MLFKSKRGKILYAIALEKGLKQIQTSIVYLHAKDRADAVSQVLRSIIKPGVRVVSMAPAVGVTYDDPKRSKDTPTLYI